MKTRITELFGIEHPVMCAGMNNVTEAKLVSAVSNAGGLGVLATSRFTPEEAGEEIVKIKELTDKPFGINQALSLPGAGKTIDMAIKERVPVINYTLGKPWFVEQVHQYGGKVLGTVAFIRHAVRAEQLGCDAITVTGFEAAAHGGDATSMVLIPLVTSAVKVPVIAAGGFFNGRGLAAALVLGADGISMGTRFAVTKECIIHESTKQLMLNSTELDTLYADIFDGISGRVLKAKGSEALMNKKLRVMGKIGWIADALRVRKKLELSWWDLIRTSVIMSRGEEGRNLWQQLGLASSSFRQERAIHHGDTDYGLIYAGQGLGGTNDLPTVAELIERIVAEAEQALESSRGKALA